MSSSALVFVITLGLCLNKRDAVEAVGAGRIAMTSTLENLIAAMPSDQILSIEGNLESEISAPVVESSSDVEPGGLFVARAGQAADGHQYIPDAIAAGAAAIVGETEQPDLPVPYVRVKNAKQVLGYLAAAYHDFPSRKLVVIGVTGTDGKTTTCHLLQNIFNFVSNIKVGYISTIAADFGSETAPTGLHVTTPGAPQIQAYLAKMVEAGTDSLHPRDDEPRLGTRKVDRRRYRSGGVDQRHARAPRLSRQLGKLSRRQSLHVSHAASSLA